MSLETIVKFGFNTSIKGDGQVGSRLTLAAQTQTDLLALMRELAGRIGGIKADPDLTERGKQKAVGKLRELYTAALARFDGSAPKSLREHLAGLKLKAQPPAVDSESPAAAIRQMELRTWLRSLDAEHRNAAFRQAVEGGDAEMVTAFARAPKAMALIHERVLQEGLKMLAESRDPALAAEIGEYADAVDAMDATLSTCREVLDKATLGAMSPEDRVRELAEKKAAGE